MLQRATSIPQPKSKDPFAGDRLHRDEVIVHLTDILGGVKQPFTVSLEAPWGQGKTTFLGFWEKYLEKKGYKVLQINAWETDYINDPVIVITGSMLAYFEKAGTGLDRHLTLMKRAVGSFMKWAPPRLADIAAASKHPVAAFVTKWISSTLVKRMDKIDENRVEIANFKKELAQVASKISKQRKPLFVFVDELDRCRPTYAVAFLERLKHLFNVENIVYVLAIDPRQLVDTIQLVYGMKREEDAFAYLRRFIDYRFRLPRPSTRDFCQYLTSRYGLDEVPLLKDTVNEQIFINDCIALFDHKGFGLREQEQCFTEIRLGLLGLKTEEPAFLRLVPALAVLRNCALPLYLQIRDDVPGWYQVLNEWAGKPRVNQPLKGVMRVFQAIYSVFTDQIGRESTKWMDILTHARKGDKNSWTLLEYMDRFPKMEENPALTAIHQIDMLAQVSAESATFDLSQPFVTAINNGEYETSEERRRLTTAIDELLEQEAITKEQHSQVIQTLNKRR